jgi:hypothetical protein
MAEEYGPRYRFRELIRQAVAEGDLEKAATYAKALARVQEAEGITSGKGESYPELQQRLAAQGIFRQQSLGGQETGIGRTPIDVLGERKEALKGEDWQTRLMFGMEKAADRIVSRLPEHTAESFRLLNPMRFLDPLGVGPSEDVKPFNEVPVERPTRAETPYRERQPYGRFPSNEEVEEFYSQMSTNTAPEILGEALVGAGVGRALGPPGVRNVQSTGGWGGKLPAASKGYGATAAEQAGYGYFTADDPESGAVAGAVMGPAAKMAFTNIGRIPNTHRGRFIQKPLGDFWGSVKAPAERTRELGGQIPRAAASSSPDSSFGQMARDVEHVEGMSPFSSGQFRKMWNNNRRVLARAFARSFGSEADLLTTNALEQAGYDIGQEFATVAKGVKRFPIERALADSIIDAAPRQRAGRIADMVRKGWLSGDEYIRIRGWGKDGLGKIAASESDNAVAAHDIIDELDDRFEAYVPERMRQNYRIAREHWKNYLLTQGKDYGEFGPTPAQAKDLLEKAYNETYINDYGRTRPNFALEDAAGEVRPLYPRPLDETQDLFDVTRTLSDRRMGVLSSEPTLAGWEKASMLGPLALGGGTAAAGIPGVGAASIMSIYGPLYAGPRLLQGQPTAGGIAREVVRPLAQQFPALSALQGEERPFVR